MKKIITYGTFDLFHQGHYNLLARAKKEGDYLIVGITTNDFDIDRGKLNVVQSLEDRIENVRNTGLADQILIEHRIGQKISDVIEFNIDSFVVGSDWVGKFDYLSEYCEVKYLERTKDISSTIIRNRNRMVQLGIVGTGRIASRFIPESKYVSGIDITGVYSPNTYKQFADKFEINFSTNDFEALVNEVDALYIASPHSTHYPFVKKALQMGKHILCEKPLTLNLNESKELYQLAKKSNLVLLEAIKTAYSPGFIRLIEVAKSGLIGNIKDISATFTKIEKGSKRELDALQNGGSVNELASYPLLGIIKLLGEPHKIDFFPFFENKIDFYTKIILHYDKAIATAQIGLGAKSEGSMIITGTKGYIYVPAPWWKTEEFEVRFENFDKNTKYFYKFHGDGLRYEIAEFINLINNPIKESNKLSSHDSIAIAKIISKFNEIYLNK